MNLLKKTKNQSGRSMVEMLGVLAIIGVLSVTAIAGYRYAMNRHAANEWLNNWFLFKTGFEAHIYTNGNKVVEGDSFEMAGFKVTTEGHYEDNTYYENFETPVIKNREVCKMIAEQVEPFQYISSYNFVQSFCFLGGEYYAYSLKEGCNSKDATFPSILECEY